MKIVVLDGATLNPGDLSWSELEALGECRIFPRSTPAETLVRAADAELALVNKAVLSRELIARLPALKYIGVTATGVNVVDLEAARERGIPVTNVPAYSTRSVAQATLALLLELTNGVGEHARGVRAGRWSQCPDFGYWESPLIELDGLTLGIIGLGRIGRAVAELATALGMKVIGVPRRKGAAAPIPEADLETALRASDVLSLHCPLTPETHQLLNAERLAWMKPAAFLLNTSRGGLIDEYALARALNEGRLAGAGLDVLSAEPPPPDHPLLTARNCIITPHHAWATLAARRRLLRVTLENLRAFLRGQPENVVNGVTPARSP